MGQFLTVCVRLIGAALAFVRVLRSLISERSPQFRLSLFRSPLQLELEPASATTQEILMLEFQIDIEKLFHKNQLIPRIKAEFLAEPEFAQWMDDHEIDQEFGFALLVQMVLHKRATVPILVGILRHHFDDDCQATADALDAAARADLVDWSPVTQQFIIKYGITPDVQAEIDRYQYPLPMVVPPLPLKDNHDTGYYTSRNSVILRDNHHDDDVCLESLDQINATRFRINQDVSTTIRNRWRHLDKPKPDEDMSEYRKRVKAFEKYDRTAHDVIQHLGLAAEGEFYLTHKYDKRGRIYCQGYVVNYQGTEWNKAVIEFADQEVVS